MKLIPPPARPWRLPMDAKAASEAAAAAEDVTAAVEARVMAVDSQWRTL